MRNISFSLTVDQFKARTKTVTRRLGWLKLKVGEVLMGCKKCQGLKPGETIVKLGPIRVVSVRREPIYAVDEADVVREGFPGWTPGNFIAYFCTNMKVQSHETVTRIEFEYLDSVEGA